MNIENFLAEWNYTMLNKPLAREIWISQAVFLCELISQRKRFKQDEFYFTQNNMESEIWLSEATQKRYTKELQERWLIIVEKKWIPARNYYTINDDKIFEIISWETCAVNLTELEQSDWPNYSNKKENKKENNIIINNNTELQDNSEFLEIQKSFPIEIMWLKEKEKSCAKKEKEITVAINWLISDIKSICNDYGVAYDNTRDRQFAKHILTAKEYWEFCDKIWQWRIEFAENVLIASIKINYWKWPLAWPMKIYQNYADLYNQAKSKMQKTITPTINVL